MIKCLIVDDEPVAQRILVSYLKEIPHTEVVGCAAHAIQAMEILQASEVDLIFLDIEMPKIRGLDFIKSLSHPPNIILTTAYREFALDGFDLGVVDYLLKPISFERFFRAMNKYKKLYYSSYSLVEKESIEQDAHILLKSDRKTHRIKVGEIKFIEGMSNYIKVYTLDKIMVVYDSLTSIQDKLPQEFIRTHKSYIVNKLWVKAFDKETIVLGEQTVPIGKSYQKACLYALEI